MGIWNNYFNNKFDNLHHNSNTNFYINSQVLNDVNGLGNMTMLKQQFSGLKGYVNALGNMVMLKFAGLQV